MIFEEWLPNSLSIGVPYGLFFHLSVKKLRAFNKAFEISQKRLDRQMLTQATYIYEAFGTVMANAFGKRKVDWRKKTYTEEYEEHNLPRVEKEKQLLHQFASDLDMQRRNFLIEKKRLENEQQTQ